MTTEQRVALGRKRILSILGRHVVANMRILEQKISDAGPTPQRIDPHHLTTARQQLLAERRLAVTRRKNVEWYHLPETLPALLNSRLQELGELHDRTSAYPFVQRVGQALEIAVLRALSSQSLMDFVGGFTDLDKHDDSTSYSKDEPPRMVSGHLIPGSKRLDFLATHPEARHVGIEVKNIRPWLYPNQDEILDLLQKCCAINGVPVLIARRIPYITRSTLGAAGVVFHETYNQLYPASDAALAALARDKNLLGYHDVRTGNEPDKRLIQFVHVNLPRILPAARERFREHFELLCGYGNREMSWPEFERRIERTGKHPL